ncbi:hypothetical protein Tco_0264691 [Tanacetum coccineum]
MKKKCMDKGSKERSPPHNLRQKPGQYICCQNHKLIADIEKRHHGPSDAMHNPSQPFEFLSTVLILSHLSMEIHNLNYSTPRLLILNRVVMSDSEDSIVTYTAVSSPYEDLSYIGSPRVDGPPVMLKDPYANVVAAFQAPPSPDYMPGPEEPEQAPPSPVYVPYVPEPVYPEFMPPEDEVLPAEEQPLPAAASPTTDSLGYIPESDPEEDPTNYLADGGDDDDDESSDDDEDDDEDVEKHEDEDEDEEHPNFG